MRQLPTAPVFGSMFTAIVDALPDVLKAPGPVPMTSRQRNRA